MADTARSIYVNALACEFPGAHDGSELYRNLMERRREFRAMPKDRLDLEAYASGIQVETDSITDIQVALISGWSFDLARFNVPRSTYENTDLTHWLALDLADRALSEIGGADGLDRDRTAVVVANTLTGEFSRAALLRLRLPFLDSVLQEALGETGIQLTEADPLRQSFAERLRRAFPDPNEDMLAGGLANTIAGRIANHFDLHGGAFTVDGACASSLVALSHAATLLATRQAEHVVVGAVDLSLDPFELVGFSRNGALAADRMRVFDRRAAGFWPGEGGAMMVVSAARKTSLPERAMILGWGMSTDGAGGLTRPSSGGQLLACRRALAAAGLDGNDLAYVEAHGTGTAVGDPTEVRALAEIASGRQTPLPVGSIKANIGHTKAAAGFAGLTKVLLALEHGVVPPHVSCVTPDAVFDEVTGAVIPALDPVPLDPKAANAIGVSSFGFGGINTHVLMAPVVSKDERRPARPLRMAIETEAEAFLLSEPSAEVMVARLEEMAGVGRSLTLARLADASRHYSRAAGKSHLRLGFVAGTGSELAERAKAARAWIDAGCNANNRPEWLTWGEGDGPPRIGFVFPGQAAPVRAPGGAWDRAFPEVQALVQALDCAPERTASRTDIAQPLITLGNLSALRVLEAVGIRPDAVAGHSLGEIAALVASGALSAAEGLRLAETRGSIMQRDGVPGGGMIRLETDAETAASLCKGAGAVVACVNGPREIVISGQARALAEVEARAAACGIASSQLKVSHAFHSSDLKPARASFSAAVKAVAFDLPGRAEFISTVTGAGESEPGKFGQNLVRQLTAPVQFEAALHGLSERVGLLIEAGPGTGLKRLAGLNWIDMVALDYGSEGFGGLYRVCAAAHCAGVALNLDRLFVGRGLRPFDPDERPDHLTSPCGARDGAPVAAAAGKPRPGPEAARVSEAVLSTDSRDLEELVRRALASETGFAPDGIDLEARFQTQMNMNSLSVARVFGAVSRQLGLPIAGNPIDFSDANASELIAYLSDVAEGGLDLAPRRIDGVDRWVRRYRLAWRGIEAPSSEACFGQVAEVLVVPSEFTAEAACALLEQIQQHAGRGDRNLAVIEDGADVSAFLRSIWKEGFFDRLVLVDRNGVTGRDGEVDSLLNSGEPGFHHFRLEANGGIGVPRFEPVCDAPETVAAPVGPVLLAVGCARGIGAECALRLAGRDTHVVFAGRSAADHPTVQATMELAKEREISASYEVCDIAEPASLADMAVRLRRLPRAPSDLLFAPAVNVPASLTFLDRETLLKTLAPKWGGFANVLKAFGGGLRNLIAFGSIIGRTGLEGEAHYALANAQQSRLAGDFARAHPDCRVLSLEWTVWSGAGMGERLGVIDRLATLGVDAVNFDSALGEFDRLIADGSRGTMCITSRFGDDASLDKGRSTGAPFRFLESILIDYPGVELVAGARLHPGRDRYLDGHRIDGAMVLPGVAGIEAMAQAAEALSGAPQRHAKDVAFHRPMQIPPQGRAVRIAALRMPDGDIQASLFGSDDEFRAPAMTCRFAAVSDAPVPDRAPMRDGATTAFSLGPLYGGRLFFHEGRYELGKQARVIGSRSLSVEIFEMRRVEFRAVGARAGGILAD